jgi:hypothetical protein
LLGGVDGNDFDEDEDEFFPPPPDDITNDQGPFYQNSIFFATYE